MCSLLWELYTKVDKVLEHRGEHWFSILSAGEKSAGRQQNYQSEKIVPLRFGECKTARGSGQAVVANSESFEELSVKSGKL
ncbi:MAG: hypothetical protein OXF62_20540 [Caldilineaceae bacterium]|nr:hypothetical protein [Caldilineaceae bacterium]